MIQFNTKRLKLDCYRYLAILLAFTACSKVEDKVTTDQLVLELMNGGRYHDASIVLESQIIDEPDNQLAKLRLASSYAGESGFSLVEAFAAFEPLIYIGPSKSRLPKEGQSVNSTPLPSNDTNVGNSDSDAPTTDSRLKLKKFEKNLLLSVFDAEVTLKILFNLPYLDELQRNKIKKAIVILRRIPDSYSQHRVGLIYEGILQFLLFSNYFRDGFVGITNSENEPALALKIYCGLDLTKLFKALPNTVGHLRASLAAVAEAGSDTESKFFTNAARALKTANVVNNLYLHDTNLFTLADAGNRTFKDEICHE